MRPFARLLLPLSLLSALLLLGGCKSTEKKFDAASELETEGRYPEAAEAYLDVLERDAEWPGAKERLAEIGPRAITQLFDDGTAKDDAGDAVTGLTVLTRLTDIVDRATRFGVILLLPDAFGSRLDDMTGRAVGQLEKQAQEALSRRSFETALSAYDRALSDYAITSDRREGLELSRASALLDWSRDDAASGSYLSAHNRALEAAAALNALDPKMAEEARRVATDAVEAGRVFVAVTPFWQTDVFRSQAPRAFLSDINDALAFDHLKSPSPFIEVLDPGQTRRDVRLMRLDDAILDRLEMAQIGRELDVEFVLSGDGVSFLRTERVRSTKNVASRTRGRNSQPATYRRVDLDVNLKATISYRIVNVVDRRVVRDGAVEGVISDRFDRAFFDGDWRTLDIANNEREMFDDIAHADQEEDLGFELADKLAADLSAKIFADVLSLID